MALLRILFFILIVLFPLGEITRFQLQNGVAIRLNDVLVCIVVLLWLLRRIHKRNVHLIFNDRIIQLLIIFYATGLFSLLLSISHLTITNFFVSFLFLLRFVSYTMLYAVAREFSEQDKKKIFFLLLFSGVIFLLVGFLQLQFYSDLANLSYLEWDNHVYRLFSSFFDPNFAGAFLVLLLIVFSAVAVRFLEERKKWQFCISLFFVLITLSGMYLTYSRSAILAMLAGMSTLLILKGKNKIILLLFASLVIAFLVFSKNFYIVNMNLLRVASSEARIDSAQTAISIIKQNIAFGVGFNAYKYAQVRYGFRKGTDVLKSHADAGTDNSFLFVLATTGILGFIIYVGVLITILKRAVQVLRFPKTSAFQKTIAIVIISSLVGLIVNAQFINSLFYPFILEWVFILLGLMLPFSKLRESK